MSVEAFRPQGPIERFDQGIVRRLPRPRQVDPVHCHSGSISAGLIAQSPALKRGSLSDSTNSYLPVKTLANASTVARCESRVPSPGHHRRSPLPTPKSSEQQPSFVCEFYFSAIFKSLDPHFVWHGPILFTRNQCMSRGYFVPYQKSRMENEQEFPI